MEILKNTTEATPAWGEEVLWSVEIFLNTTLTGIVPQRVGTEKGQASEVNQWERNAVERGVVDEAWICGIAPSPSDQLCH